MVLSRGAVLCRIVWLGSRYGNWHPLWVMKILGRLAEGLSGGGLLVLAACDSSARLGPGACELQVVLTKEVRKSHLNSY